MVIEVKRMFNNGPLRFVSDHKENNSWLGSGNGEFRGMYVCDSCQQGVVGVYRAKNAQNNTAKWLCMACYKSVGALPKGRRSKS